MDRKLMKPGVPDSPEFRCMLCIRRWKVVDGCWMCVRITAHLGLIVRLRKGPTLIRNHSILSVHHFKPLLLNWSHWQRLEKRRGDAEKIQRTNFISKLNPPVLGICIAN